MADMSAQVVSVNVGTSAPVAWGGREFVTAILKHAVRGPIALRGVNFDGDDQADRTVHGGPSKAVYAYAIEDYAWWSAALQRPLSPGTFGENLTTTGLDVSSALIGERWRLGSVVLEVSEPRIPCFKLGYALGDHTFAKRFAHELRPGAYLRIVDEGSVQAGDGIAVSSRPEHSITVREVSRIRLFAPSERRRLLDVTALSLAWRGWAASGDAEDR